MAFKPLSQFNAFFKLARERTLCGLDQLVGLHIQQKFNLAHWAETIQIADAELLECISWYDKTGSPTSIDSIRAAKARLKKKGLIDFKSGKGNKPTEYRLVQLYPSDTPSDTPPDTPCHSGCVCYTTGAGQDVEDVKTEERKRGASVRDNREAKTAKVNENEAELTKPNAAIKPALPLRSPLYTDVFKAWTGEIPKSLTTSIKYGLSNLEERFGEAKVIEAIIAESQERTYPTFEGVKGRLIGESKPKTKIKKSGESRVSSEINRDERDHWEFS